MIRKSLYCRKFWLWFVIFISISGTGSNMLNNGGCIQKPFIWCNIKQIHWPNEIFFKKQTTVYHFNKKHHLWCTICAKSKPNMPHSNDLLCVLFMHFKLHIVDDLHPNFPSGINKVCPSVCLSIYHTCFCRLQLYHNVPLLCVL